MILVKEKKMNDLEFWHLMSENVSINGGFSENEDVKHVKDGLLPTPPLYMRLPNAVAEFPQDQSFDPSILLDLIDILSRGS